jgi:hypothetical protein
VERPVTLSLCVASRKRCGSDYLEDVTTHYPTPVADPTTVVRALSARFPLWTIWWGEATTHYWGMSRRRGNHFLVEALSAQEFVQRAREIEG